MSKRGWRRSIAAAVGLSICCAAIVASGQSPQERFAEGQDYILLKVPLETDDPQKVEVVELFSYGCPHCFNLEPAIKDWREKLDDNVSFKRVHAVFTRSWEPLARAYYTAKSLKVLPSIHEQLFEAIHEHQLDMRRTDLLAHLFENRADIERDEFLKVFNSFGVVNQMRQGVTQIRLFRATGVPAFGVDGRYLVETPNRGNNARMLEIVDFLVAKVIAERNEKTEKATEL